MKARKIISTCLVLLLGVAWVSTGLYAQEAAPEWKSEFERICGQTIAAVSLEQEQLQELINDSKNLLEEIKRSEDPAAKIYVFRLEKCKVFFEYARDLKEDW